MKIGSLFSGIGGLELGLESAGVGHVLWQVEQDDFCRQILAKHWPNADRKITDVRTATATNLYRVDVLCGGFPCQDVSGAGKGAGLSGERSGLWFEYHRLVRELQPTAVVVENVASGKIRWLPTVRRMLEAIGYRTRAITVAAADCGAPHIRRRIFVLGLADSLRERLEIRSEQFARAKQSAVARSNPAMDHADGIRQSQCSGHDCELGRRTVNTGEALGHSESTGRELVRSPAESDRTGQTGLAEPRVGRMPDGPANRLDLPTWWPLGQGHTQDPREPTRTIQKGTDANRCARLKALGNAVVPHCGYVAGKALIEWMEAGQ